MMICLMSGAIAKNVPMSDDVADLDAANMVDELDKIPWNNFLEDKSGIKKDIPGPPLGSGDLELANDQNFQERMAERNQNPQEEDPISLANAFEGDILNVNAEDIKELLERSSTDGMKSRNAIRDPNKKWPNGVVPYVISQDFSADQRALIAKAMEEYHTKTCIKFIPRTSENAYIHFLKGPICSSDVGRSGTEQSVNLADGCDKPSIMHELMHAIGIIYHRFY